MKKSERLAELESSINEALLHFRDIGDALWEIKTKSLWVGQYKSWPAYLKLRWNFSPRWGEQLCQAHFGVKALATEANAGASPVENPLEPYMPLIRNAKVAAELSTAPIGRVREVAETALRESFGKAPTPKVVRAVVKRMKNEQRLAPEATWPDPPAAASRRQAAKDARTMLDELAKRITDLREIFEQASGEGWGRWLRDDQPGTLNPAIWAVFRELHELVKCAVPGAICGCTAPGCKACFGLGWMPSHVFSLLPSGQRHAARKLGNDP